MSNWKRVFAIIWTGQFFSLLSSSIVNFAVILWLSIETGSAEVLAYAAIAALLPQSVLGLFTGVYIDRWDRKLIMILSDSFIALCTAVMVLLFYFGETEIWQIYILLALRSAGAAFHMPAMQASIPLLAPETELMRIAGINQAIHSVCTIAAPALGALFLGWFDIGTVLLCDIAGAVIGAGSLLFVKIPSPGRKDGEHHIFKELLLAVKETVNKRMTLLFAFSILATFCIMPVSVLFPLMTLKHFNGSTFQVSLIEIVWGVGMLAGGILLGTWKAQPNKVVLINFMYILLGISFAVSGMLPGSGYTWFVVLTAIGGISGSIYNAAFTALLQQKIEAEMLGRVFSMFISVSLLPALIGLAGTGFMADSIGLGSSFIIMGSVIFLLGLAGCFIPSLIRLGISGTSGPSQTQK